MVRVLEEGKDCKDVATQLSAVSKALDRAGFGIIASGLEQCIVQRDASLDKQELEKLFLSPRLTSGQNRRGQHATEQASRPLQHPTEDFSMTYTRSITVPLSWSDAVQSTREALGEQGFGILAKIDVGATFTTKLGTDAGDAVGDSGPVTRTSPAVPSPRNHHSKHYRPATSSSAAAAKARKRPSKRSTRTPWSN